MLSFVGGLSTPETEDVWPEDDERWWHGLEPEIRDERSKSHPIAGFNQAHADLFFRSLTPEQLLSCHAKDDEPYLYPMLASNEAQRLRALWYFTRDITRNGELLASLEATADLVREVLGADGVICGLLDLDAFARISTSRLPRVISPRREATCSYSLAMPPDAVTELDDMLKDWRFAASPAVKYDGLQQYYGAPLSFTPPGSDEPVTLGSLCVASLFSCMSGVAKTYVDCSHSAALLHCPTQIITLLERQQLSHSMAERLAKLQTNRGDSVKTVISTMLEYIPKTKVSVRTARDGKLRLSGHNLETVVTGLPTCIWEDEEVLADYIANFNHLAQPPRFKRALRAIIVPVPETTTDYVLVETANIRHIFDQIDVDFVRSCAQHLAKAAQDRRLQSALTAKIEFIRNISHGLRTPINGVLASCELLGESFAPGNSFLPATKMETGSPTMPSHLGDQQLSSLLHLINSSASDLLNVVNNVIDLGEMESLDMVKPEMQLVSIAQLEHDILKMAAQVDRAVKGKMSSICLLSNKPVSLPRQSSLLYTDPLIFQQCVIALITSACAHTKEGCVTLHWSFEENVPSFALEIADDGPGIPAEIQTGVYNPYQQAMSMQGQLSYAIAAKHAAAIGGVVELVSSSDKGTHLRLSINNVGLACQRTEADSEPQSPRVETSGPLRCHFVARDSFESGRLVYLQKNLKELGHQMVPFEAADVVFAMSTKLDNDTEVFPRLRSDQVLVCIIRSAGDLDEVRRISHSQARSAQTIYSFAPVSEIALKRALAQASKVLEHRAPLQVVSPYTPMDLPGSFVLPTRVMPQIAEHAPKVRTPENLPDEAMGDQNEAARSRIPDGLFFDSDPIKTPQLPAMLRSTLRLLIVDDNNVNLEVLKMYCKKRKFDYVCAIDGRLAFEEYKRTAESDSEGDLTLVVTDLQMPVMDGAELSASIRTYERKQGRMRCPIYVVTGQSHVYDRQRSLQSGADAFFTKPLSLKTLDMLIDLQFPSV